MISREIYSSYYERSDSMSKILSKEQVEEQRLCYAVKACHLMGFDVEKTADLLETDVAQVKTLYTFIEKDMIDFNSK